jgi:hypothetical protein
MTSERARRYVLCSDLSDESAQAFILAALPPRRVHLFVARDSGRRAITKQREVMRAKSRIIIW